jgi:hypothetical protein
MAGAYAPSNGELAGQTGSCSFPAVATAIIVVACTGPSNGNGIKITISDGPRVIDYIGTLDPISCEFTASGSGSYGSGPACSLVGTIDSGFFQTVPTKKLFFQENFTVSGCCSGSASYNWITP